MSTANQKTEALELARQLNESKKMPASLRCSLAAVWNGLEKPNTAEDILQLAREILARP